MKVKFKNKLKICCVIALGLIICCSAFIYNFKNNGGEQVFANSAVISSEEIKDTYSKNDNVLFPENVTVSYNGNEYTGKYVGCQTAEGSIYSLKAFECNKLGVFNALYSFTAENQNFIAKKSFTVNNPLFSPFTNENSKVEYGDLTYMPKSNEQKTQGLILTLGEGDVFTFNQPINVKDNTVNEILNFYPAQLVRHWETQSIGYQNEARKNAGEDLLDYPTETIDCNRIHVTLTDAYNPNNVVVLQLKFSTDYKSRSLTAVTSGVQGDVALDPYSGGAEASWTKIFDQVGIKVDESDSETTRYMVWNSLQSLIRGSEAQYLTGSYKDGGNDDVNKGATKFDLYWKLKTSDASNLVFFSNTSANTIPDLKDKFSNRLVSDLSNQSLSTTGEIFKGFTNGEAYVSISCEGFINNAKSTQIEIYSIGGVSGEALTATTYVDDVKPNINVNLNNAEKYSYVGVVNQAINIPTVTAFDVNLAGNASTLVYYNYGLPSQSLVSVKNGKFIPNHAGEYSIVYSATDAFGNLNKKVVDINVIKNNENPHGINMGATPVSTCIIGDTVILPEYNGVNYNGNVACSISVTSPSGEKVSTGKNSQFIAGELGKYKVVYELSDELYNQQFVYEIEVQAGDKYFYMDLPDTDNYYIKDSTNTFDDCYVYHLENGKVNKYLANVYVRYDKTGEFIKSDALDKVCIAKTGTPYENAKFVEFRYGYTLPDNTVLYSDIFGLKDENVENIINVNYLGQVYEDEMIYSTFDIGKYFIGDISNEIVGQARRITDTKGYGNNKFAFANKIMLNSLQLKFVIPEGQNNYDAVNFYLTDVKDAENQIKISIIFKYHHTYASVNDGNEIDITHFVKVNGDSRGGIENHVEKVISYLPNANCLEFKTSKRFNLALPSQLPEKCYLEVEFVNIKGQASIDLLSINSQALNSDTDNGRPKIVVESSGGNYEYGSIIPIYSAVVNDVLSPVNIKDLKVSVFDLATRKELTDTNGVLLKNVSAENTYYIQATYDRIQVSYEGIADGYGNSTSFRYLIYVVDTEKPTVEFNDGSTEKTVISAKVGEEISIKEFTVSDNKSANDKLFVKVLLYNPNNNFETFIAGGKVTINRKGLFCIRVFVQDEAGNVNRAMYYVNVE